MARPRLLDLFSGAGGAACGYHRAGFDVTGVDHTPQPRYPFAHVVADALEYVAEHGAEYDVIHASPPCQWHSRCRRIGNARPGHEELVEPTRRLLIALGKPWVIENVEGAPLHHVLILCGTMFALPLIRHRWFQTSHLLFRPGRDCCHAGGEFGVYAGKVTKVGTRAASYRDARGRTHYRPRTGSLDDGRRAMGIDWMNVAELSHAVPPAYTEFIGKQLLRCLKVG